MEKQKKMHGEYEKKAVKICLLISATLTFCLIFAGILLVMHFIRLNHEFIIHPESSPGYSGGAPFGDGGDVWRKAGIYLPTSMSVFLIELNLVGILVHFHPTAVKWYVFLPVALAIALVISICTLCDDGLAALFGMASVLLVFPSLILIPGGIAASVILFARHERILSGHVALLVLSMSASFLMEWFSSGLYLD